SVRGDATAGARRSSATRFSADPRNPLSQIRPRSGTDQTHNQPQKPEVSEDFRFPVRGAAMARDLVRDEVVLSASTWVVKVGTSVLAAADGTLDLSRLGHLAEQISTIADTGRRVALVSSGAVGAGLGSLGLHKRPDNLPQ